MRHTQIGLGSVYYDKHSKLWRAAFTTGYDGKGRQIRRTVSAKTQSRVLEKRQDLIRQITEGSKAKGQLKLKTWITDWLHTTAHERLHPQVWADQKTKVNRYIIPALGEYLLEDVGPEEVRELWSTARASGMSDRTVQITHSVLSAAMRDAVREGKLQVNPCEQTGRPKAKSKQRQALTVMEARRLIVTAEKEKDPLTELWACALMLGARASELRGLELTRVAPDMSMIDISWQLQRIPWRHGADCRCPKDRGPGRCLTRELNAPAGFDYRVLEGTYCFTRPKTSASVRMVPVPDPLAEALRRRMERVGPNRCGLMWVAEKGGPLPAKLMTDMWKKACRAASVPEVHFHCARHTAASLLLEMDVSPEVIRQILGHSTVLSTQTYMHVSQRMAMEAMRKMGEVLPIGV